ncbi:MAG: peptidyl-prolyl cis-trans isomerase [Rubricoccaceae bacterium]|nr:peptidyl-prolyl cis-trans isomerase [Rubricoccaceae bacterium]
MTKMRESTGVVLWVLVGAFGILWVLQDSGAFEAVGITTSRDVALVNGEHVDYEMYQRAVQQRMDLFQQQGAEMTPALQAQIEDEVFDALVEHQLRLQEMERLGVEVSDAEVEAAFTGPNPDPLVVQVFGDAQGNVDRNTLMQFVQQADPAQVSAFEEDIRTSRRQAKLDALIQATARVTEGEVEAQYLRNNRLANAQVVSLRYADVPDADVEVTERDLRAYYDEHREDFERPTTYDVEYVTFEKVPSPEDSARVRQELLRLRPQLEAAEDPAAWVAQNAYGEGEAAFVSPNQLSPDLAAALYEDLTPGRIVGPVLAGEEGVLAYVTDVRDAENGPFARARHVLFPADQAAEAERVKAQIQSGALSFEQAAARHSQDQANKNEGGDLGWFGPGRMVAAFEEAVMSAPVGQVIGPVETQFGQHLVRVEARTNREAELVRLSLPLVSTNDRLIEEAEDLRYYAEAEAGGFADEATRRGLDVQTASVRDDQPVVPGVQIGRDAARWMRRADPGDISDPLDAGDRFVVFHLTDVVPEGTRPFDEVRAEIEPRVLLEKKKEVVLERLREARAAGGTLSAVAERVGAEVTPLTGLRLGTTVVQGVGNEPALVGTVFGQEAGETSRAVAGEAVGFIVRTTGFEGGDLSEFTDEERTRIREQLLQRKRSQVLQMWMQSLRDEAEVEDFRDRML